MSLSGWNIFLLACIALASFNCWKFKSYNTEEYHGIQPAIFSDFYERSLTIPDIKPYRAHLLLSLYLKNKTLYYGETHFPFNVNNLYSVMLVRNIEKRDFSDQLEYRQVQLAERNVVSRSYPLIDYPGLSTARIYPGKKEDNYYLHFFQEELVFVPESLMPALGGGQ